MNRRNFLSTVPLGIAALFVNKIAFADHPLVGKQNLKVLLPYSEFRLARLDVSDDALTNGASICNRPRNGSIIYELNHESQVGMNGIERKRAANPGIRLFDNIVLLFNGGYVPYCIEANWSHQYIVCYNKNNPYEKNRQYGEVQILLGCERHIASTTKACNRVT